MNFSIIRQACRNLGHLDVSIEEDGTCWSGTEDNKQFVDPTSLQTEIARLESVVQASKQAVLDRLGITAEEARLLLS